jgi:hypothetical protein
MHPQRLELIEKSMHQTDILLHSFFEDGERSEPYPVINTSDYATLPQLRALTFELEAIIDNLNKVTRPSLENINKVAEIKAIKDRVELLIKTRSKAGYSDAMKKAIEQIEQLQEMQKNIIYDGTYIINGKTMERVTRAIQKFLPEQYKYKYEKKVVAAFDKAMTEYLNENPNITEPNEAFVDAFIENVKLKQVKGDGISTSTLKEMKAEMLNFIKRGYISREGAVTPIQNGNTTVTAPTSEDGMDQRWVFQIVNGAVISGKHTVSFNGSVAQEADVTDPDATYNRLRKNKTVDYVFNAVSTESPLDKFEILKEEVKIVVAEKTYEEATAAGNYIDAAVKQLFNGETPVFDPAKITQEAYDSLFGPQGHLAKIKEMVDTGQYYMVSTGLRVYDEDAGIAGEIDLLLVDQTGKFVIIDVKTGKEDKWEGYNDITSIHYNKKIENTYQQAAYARILKNMFPDIDAEISILPIQITYNDETALITSVSRPSDKKALKPGEKRLLAPGKFLVGLDKNSVKEDIDKLIPEKGVAPKAPAQTPPTVRTKLYKLGFSKDMVDLMSDEDIAIAEAATDESEVKDLVAKYDLLTQEATPQDDVVPVVTGEEEVVSSLSFGTPVAEMSDTPSTDIETKKADILERKRKNLEDTGDTFDYVSREPREDGRFNAFYTKTKEIKIFDTYQEAIDWVSSKYDAELARELYKEILGGKVVTEMTVSEQQVADTYITAELRKSVDAELASLEKETTLSLTSVSDVEAQLKGVNDMDAFNAFKAELNTKFTKQEINPVDIEAIN